MQDEGKLTPEELNAAAASNYDADVLWDIWVKTPEMVAEMDLDTRKEYGHIAYIDYCSTGYICRQLINAVDPFEYGYDTKDLCFIVRVS